MLDKKLPSGLRLLVEPVGGAPVVAVQVWIGTGGFDELDGERGLAHLHEHMLFKGTPSRPVGEIAAAVERAGGQINAWTSNDQTCYHTVMPAHSWHVGVDVLADAVCHSLFDADELNREIEVVIEEIRRAADSPGQVGWQRMFGQAFAGHPYSLPVLGSEESVRGMTPERMRAFWQKHYTAPNTTVVICGDVTAEEAEQAVAAAFADQSAARAPAKPAGHALPLPAGQHVEASKFSESRCLLAWPIPHLTHRDVPAIDVLALVLGQGDSSRLVQRVQRDLRLANDIGASSWTPQYGGLFAVTILTSADRLAAARQETLRMIEQVRRDGIDPAELQKAKHNVVAEATYKLETVQGQAQSLGYFAAATGDPHWDRTYADRVEAVTVDDVRRAARNWLRADTAQVVALLGQDADNVQLPDANAELSELLSEFASPASLAVRAPDVVDGIERIVLPSGDILLVQPDYSVPLFGLRAAAVGGLRAEDPTCNGRSHLLGNLLTRGTAQRSSKEIAHEIENLAAGLAGSAGRNSLGLQAMGQSKHARQIVELFCESLFDAELPDDSLEQERQSQLEDLRHQGDAPSRQALRAMAEGLYGSHPYAMDLLGNPASVQALTRAELLAYVRGRLAPGRLTYAVSGAIDPAQLAEWLSERTPTGRTPLPAVVSRPVDRPTQKRQIRPVAHKQQAHLAIGFVGARLHDPQRYALDVLATVLSGQSGRLFMELRDRQSLAYTVSAMHVEGLDEGYFALYMGTSPEKVDQALAGLYAEVDKIRQDGVSALELERAKRSLAGSIAIGLQPRSSRAATLCLNELYGLGREAYRGQIDSLLGVSAGQVLQAAREVLDVDRCVEVVLAPAKA